MITRGTAAYGMLRIASLFLAGALAAQPASDASRLTYTINDGWRFASGATPAARAIIFADSAWQRVSLPHTWNVADALSEAMTYHRGEGWYRRSLPLDVRLRGRRLFLHFEGANQVAEVFVNGTQVGRHVGGYTAFTVDFTDAARFDVPNVIAVRVTNAHDADIPPLNADFTFYGGIYRDVWLIATHPVRVTLADHGSSGVFVDTPTISERAATVRVRGTIDNGTRTAARARVVSRVRDPRGVEVASVQTTVTVPAGGSAPFRMLSAPIRGPALWRPDSPSVYTVTTEIALGTQTVDRLDVPLGFRWFAVDPDRGAMLNGRPIELIGTNRHQDRLGSGNALYDWMHREDVRIVKATGFNFLRLAHYPQDPAVLDEADRAGLAIWEEIPVVNMISMSDAFAENAERMLVEMVRQHYNHPSVLMWGYMNEVLLVKPNPMPDGYRARALAVAQRLERRLRAEDSTRRTVMAISFDEIDDGSGMQDVTEILGLNLYFGWYYRTLEGLGPYLDSLHARHPRRPLLISEYGAGSDERIHTRAPRPFDFSAEWHQRFHEVTLPQLLERDYLVGTAVWNQFDFTSKFRHDSKPNINQKGLLYLDRRPKDLWYYYRARLTSEPVLHVATRDHALRAGASEADRVQAIKVYSNVPEVELFLGDSSLGRRRPENAQASWDVRLRNGENRLRAVSRGGSRSASDETIVRYTDQSRLLAPNDVVPAVMSVNVGSHYEYVASGGTVFLADQPYAQGRWGYVGGQPQLIHHRIFGTEAHPLYQAALEGLREYRFDVLDGEYMVELFLAETRHAAAGQRVFDVAVNGHPMFSALDLAGEYGRYHAVSRKLMVRAVGGRGIIVAFTPRAGEPILNAVLVRRMSP